MFLAVLVHGQKFLLLSVEETDHVATFQYVVQVLPVLHEQRDLPRSGRIDHVDLIKQSSRDHFHRNWCSSGYLLASRIVGQFMIVGHVQNLAAAIHRVQDHLISEDDSVAGGAQLLMDQFRYYDFYDHIGS